jgi:two-component system, cell cycle sensor histidine kinase and response regulator CckA
MPSPRIPAPLRPLVPAFAALAAAAGLVALHAWMEVDAAEDLLALELPARAERAGEVVAQFVGDARTVLGEVMVDEQAACGIALASHLRVLPRFADLHLKAPGGWVRCTAQGLGPGGAGVLSERTVGVPVAVATARALSGAEWVLPVEGVDGRVRGLLRLEAAWGLLSALRRSEGEMLTLADTTGAVVARAEDGALWVGRPAEDEGGSGWVRPPPGTGVRPDARLFRGRGPDGIDRYWTVVPVPGTPWVLGAGVPREAALAPIRDAAWRDVLLVLALLGVMGLALVATRDRFASDRLDRAHAARARADAATREARERFRLVLRASRDLIWDWDVPGGRVFRNDALRLLLGESATDAGADEMTTGGGTSSLERWLARIPESDRERVREALDALLAGEDTALSIEYPLGGADGRRLRIRDRWYVVRDPGGAPLRVVGVASDVTDDRRRTEEVRRSKERYEAVIRTAPFGFFLARTDGLLAEWNRALERMVGERWTHDAPPRITAFFAVADTFHRLVEEARGGGSVVGREVAWLRPDGGELVVRITLNPFRTSDQRSVEGVVENITEQRRLEEQARHAQKMEAVGRLAGGVAHDFNNLLTVITGEARILLADNGLDADTRESLEAVLEAGTRGTTLTRQLLTVSRRQVVHPVPLQVNEVVGRVQAMLTRLLGEKVVLTTRLGSDLPPAEAAEGELDQILLNLALNARDALPPEGGHIEIRTESRVLSAADSQRHAGLAPGAYVLLSVEDGGSGIDPRIVSRIFEPFFTTKGAGRGTGLGLSMVYGMVTRVGGTVEVTSRMGEGTTFDVFLPVAREGASAVRPPAPVRVSGPGAGERVALVEDEEAVRRMAFRVLERAGYDVMAFPHPDEALAWLRDPAESVDILLTDVRMPGMDGNVLADRVHEVRPFLPVLYMSGYPEETTIDERVREKHAAFLAKPFTPDGLLEAVRMLLGTTPPAHP